MKKADTLFRRKSQIVTEVVVAIKEIYHAITSLTGEHQIMLENYARKFVCDRVGAYTYPAEGPEKGAEWGTMQMIYRHTGEESVHIVTTSKTYTRIDDLYDYSIDELIYIYDELEKIYNWEKKKNRKTA